MPSRKNDIKVRLKMETTSKWEDHLAGTLQSRAGQAAYQNARKVVSVARQLVPQPPGVSKTGYVRTGKLRDSIRRERVATGHHRILADATNESGDEYGRYVEYGTRNMRAQPFFNPAFRSVRPKFKRDVANLLKDKGR